MSNLVKVAIHTLEELFVHALTLEQEAVEWFQEAGDAMITHNNQEVGDLFLRLASYGRKHAAEIEELAKGKTLPHLAPWDFKWGNMSSPEVAEMGEVHYLMNAYQALELAHKSETKARDFYAGVAAGTNNPEVRKLATHFAEEESEHVALLDEWIKKTPKPAAGWNEDPDPPFMPE